MLTGILKILLLITQRVSLSKHDVAIRLSDSVVSFLWSHLDHSLDVVKHLSRESLNNLISQKGRSTILYYSRFICNIFPKNVEDEFFFG